MISAGVELAGYGIAPVLGILAPKNFGGAAHPGHNLDYQRLARPVGYDAVSRILVNNTQVSALFTSNLLYVAAFVLAILHVYLVVAGPAVDVVVPHLSEDAVVAFDPPDYVHPEAAVYHVVATVGCDVV